MSELTLGDVQERLALIEKAADDDEAAHYEQDELFRAVLRAVADGAKEGPELARVALLVDEINFSRWYS